MVRDESTGKMDVLRSQLDIFAQREPEASEPEASPRLSALALPPDLEAIGSLAAARAELAGRLEDGTRCPCCDQHAQIYRWSLYATAARALIDLYREGGITGFVESKTVKRPGQGGRMSELRHWGLVEQESERRPDGGKSGHWRVTATGQDFILKRATIPRYVYVYNGRVLWRGGEPRTIKDALGRNFDYDEMMRGIF